jgi:hypothetical protein
MAMFVGGQSQEANLAAVAATPTAKQQMELEPQALKARQLAVQGLGLEPDRIAAIGKEGGGHFRQSVHQVVKPKQGAFVPGAIWLSVKLRLAGIHGAILLFKPVDLQAPAQAKPSTMEHYPEVALADIEQRADLLASDFLHLAHNENPGDVLRQSGHAFTKGFPELRFIQGLTRVRRPIGRPVFRCPSPLGQTIGDKLARFLRGAKLQIGERGFASGSAEIIADLVLEDPEQPSPFRASASKTLSCLERRQKCFLNDIFGFGGVSQPNECVTEEQITISLNPGFGVGLVIAGEPLAGARHQAFTATGIVNRFHD